MYAGTNYKLWIWLESLNILVSSISSPSILISFCSIFPAFSYIILWTWSNPSSICSVFYSISFVNDGGSIFSSMLGCTLSESTGWDDSICCSSSRVNCAVRVPLNSSSLFLIVSWQTCTTFTIYVMLLLNPWYLAAINIAEPQRPFGLRPIEIHARFIDWRRRSAVIATWFFLLSNSNLEQYLWM